MFYNVLIKTQTNPYYLIALTNDIIARINTAYKNGSTSGIMIGSQKVFLKDLLIYKVYDNSKVNETNRGRLIDYINKSKIALHDDSYSERLFQQLGLDVTEEFPLGDWEENISVVAVTVKSSYVNQNRIDELKALPQTTFDLTKVIRLCEELNTSNEIKNWFAVGALVRALIDHIPPIFSAAKFTEVANNYSAPGKTKSFKDSMNHLDQSMRKISDSYLHSHITKSETLPNENQVDCKRDLDRLLEEIVRILK